MLFLSEFQKGASNFQKWVKIDFHIIINEMFELNT